MNIKALVLIVIGCISVIFGAVGIFLPILPTTPFVLVAAACFAGSSPKLHSALLRMPYFGDFIYNYAHKTGVKKSVKIKALIFLWISLGISALIFRKPLVIAILVIVGIAVTIHIVLIRRC